MAMNQSKAPRRDDEGFTMIEVVVAIFLLTIGLLGLAGTLTTVASRQDITESVTAMTTLGTATLEQIRDESYTSIVSLTENYGTIANFPNYKRLTIVTPNATDTLRTVEVRVLDRKGYQVSAQTVVAK